MSRPKIKTYDPSETYRYAHVKRDGIWLTLQRLDDGLHCWTRHPTDLVEQLEAHETVLAFEHRSQISQVQLYCELFAPGEDASQVKRHLADGAMDKLRIECFASPDVAPEAELEAVRDFASFYGVPFTPYIVEPRVTPAYITDAYQCEGVVYKNGNLVDWAKWKPVNTTDLVIIGYKDGRGKYAGLVGAIELGLFSHRHGRVDVYKSVGFCSGMDDKTRIGISDQLEEHLYKVVEVEYQYVGARGGLRHPRFKKLRDDKRPEECTQI